MKTLLSLLLSTSVLVASDEITNRNSIQKVNLSKKTEWADLPFELHKKIFNHALENQHGKNISSQELALINKKSLAELRNSIKKIKIGMKNSSDFITMGAPPSSPKNKGEIEKALKWYPNLSELTLGSLGEKLIVSETFHAIENLKHLSGLEISSCDQMGIQLESISMLTNLSSLTLIGCEDLETLSSISTFTNLTELRLVPGLNLNDNDLDTISHFTKLTALQLFNSCRMTNAGFIKISNLTNLTTLDLLVEPLCTCLIKDSGLASFSNLINLETLRLSHSGIADGGLKTISKYTNLTNLCLRSCFATEDISLISNLTKLRKLDLNGCGVKDTELSNFSKLKNLIDLDLSYCNVTDNGLASLSHLTNLEELSLAYCNRVTNQSLTFFSSLINLKTFMKYGTKITNKAIFDSQMVKNIDIV